MFLKKLLYVLFYFYSLTHLKQLLENRSHKDYLDKDGKDY